MSMSGEQWLNQVFRSTMTAVNRARHDRSLGMIPLDRLRVVGGRLAAQVQALGDTGVLTDEQERTALDALVEAGIMPEVRSVSVSVSSTSTSAGVSAPVAVRAGSMPVAARVQDEPPRLLGVLAGPRQLGQLDGRPVTLISAELWSDRFLVDLYTDPGPEYRSRQTRMTQEHLEWRRNQRHGHATERPGQPLADPLLQGLIWELRDEQGTEYYRTGGSAASEHYVERQRMQWSPAPSADSGRVTLLATDASGTVVLDAEVHVPGLPGDQ